MERVSLTPITQSDLDRPDSRWWMYLIPPVRRVPAYVAFLVTCAAMLAARAGRWCISKGWPILATPMNDKPAGPMPLGRVVSRASRQTVWALPGLFMVGGFLTWHAARPSVPPVEGTLGLPAGVYAERVTLTANDGRDVSAIWIPAKGTIDDQIRDPGPAVVLVHDVGHDERQMLPLVRRLHDEGFGVLAVRLRSADDASPAPTTFGATESLDVAAAVAHVRARPLVDEKRVAAWGVGYGASAIRAASFDKPLALAVLEDPVATEQSNDLRVLPEGLVYDALRPACRWMLAVGFDAGPRPKSSPARRVETITHHADGYRLIADQFSRNLGTLAGL